MRYLTLFVLLLLILSAGCKEKKQKLNASEEKRETNIEKPESTETFVSEKWHFKIGFPAGYKAGEFELPAETPVINVYNTSNVKPPPYAIHEDASLGYVAILPQGFGVDAPAGRQVSLKEWKGEVPAGFELNNNASTVYLLENGDPWAFSLHPGNPPEGWNEYGSIFLHFKINDFKAKCFEISSGKEIGMADCVPMGGKDEVKYFGKVDPESEEDLIKIVRNFSFQ